MAQAMEKLTERFENLDIEFQPVAVAYHDTNALWVADADCLKIGRAGCIEYDDWLVDDNAPEVVWFSVRLFKKNLPTISQYPKEQKEKPPKARIILSIMDHPQLQLLHTDKFLMYPVHHVPMNYKVDGKDVNTLQAHYLFIRADHKFGDFLNTKPKRSGERIEKCSIDSKNEYLWFNTDQKKWMYKNKDAEERDVWVNIGIAEEVRLKKDNNRLPSVCIRIGIDHNRHPFPAVTGISEILTLKKKGEFYAIIAKVNILRYTESKIKKKKILELVVEERDAEMIVSLFGVFAIEENHLIEVNRSYYITSLQLMCHNKRWYLSGCKETAIKEQPNNVN